MTFLITLIGFFIAGVTLAALVWSVAYPAKRIWPPNTYSTWTPVFVWVPTFALFGTLIALGLIGWGQMPMPNWARFGLGIPIILVSNIVVWNEVRRFGIAQTGGAQGTLKTDGLYRYSRNPQYVADAFMIFGWLILSASPNALAVGILAITVLIIAPFAEEPWLREHFGREFYDYCARTRRYL